MSGQFKLNKNVFITFSNSVTLFLLVDMNLNMKNMNTVYSFQMSSKSNSGCMFQLLHYCINTINAVTLMPTNKHVQLGISRCD